MRKSQQLKWIKQLSLSTPPFTVVSYEDFSRGAWKLPAIKSPYVVRSSFFTEDGMDSSQAGQFLTLVNVEAGQLEQAMQRVFASYPTAVGSELIIQQFIEPDYSGVLFAFQQNVWKLEYIRGRGEQLVSGEISPDTLLLPRFQRSDLVWNRLYKFWRGNCALPLRPLLRLSYCAGRLLSEHQGQGLDIEFAIKGQRLYLLQARTVTRPEEAEEVLTTANHREILPPRPSVFMTQIISDAGPRLYQYYRSLDRSLPARDFILQRAGMPWINLSALLDTMVHWGLPTALVCRSVGAEDFYRVGPRPWRMLIKLPVFWSIFQQQHGLRQKVRQWVNKQRGYQELLRSERELLWQADPYVAFQHWEQAFQYLYIDLVELMQNLTGAMSGPMGILDRLGWLSSDAVRSAGRSASTDYLQAFHYLRSGRMQRESFLRRYGHRGFYESDIGQARFWEYDENQWQQLEKPRQNIETSSTANSTMGRGNYLLRLVVRPVLRLVHLREWLRHMTMQFFWQYRAELLRETRERLGEDFNFAAYRPQDIKKLLSGAWSRMEADKLQYPLQSGWDMNTFLSNAYGRRVPIQHVLPEGTQQERPMLCIYPGKVKGQVWRVQQADLQQLEPPPYRSIILVADALDPGWVPFFDSVDAVASRVGGLLSHASIMLRETGVPSVTQVPASIQLEEGDLIELDADEGQIKILQRSRNWNSDARAHE